MLHKIKTYMNPYLYIEWGPAISFLIGPAIPITGADHTHVWSHANGFAFFSRTFQDKCNRYCSRDCFQCNHNWIYLWYVIASPVTSFGHQRTKSLRAQSF